MPIKARELEMRNVSTFVSSGLRWSVSSSPSGKGVETILFPYLFPGNALPFPIYINV
jgi:hypothetical protein